MGFFDSLFGKAEKPITDPEHLRNELLAASRAGDTRRLERLSRTNQAAILAYFRSWQRVPEDVRADPTAIQGYVHGLISVAQLFAEKLGHPRVNGGSDGSRRIESTLPLAIRPPPSP